MFRTTLFRARAAVCCWSAAAVLGSIVSAHAAVVTLTALPGVVGGTIAATGVYKADLSAVGIAQLLSITITDNSAGLGGAPGQFSAFDLDAIRVSYTNCADAACVAADAGESVFDFIGGTSFSPGVQRAPADLKLFGTDATGNAVDNAIATLGAFDGESTIITPFGFLSMGDNGAISFNLLTALTTSGLFLYIGEVGNNGEAAASGIIVRDTPTVPLPAAPALFALGLASLFGLRKRA
jgi:hypothetical protein